MRRLALAPLVVGALLVALVGTLVLPAPSSDAFWSVRVTGGSSSAQVQTVPQVGRPAATVANRNVITVTWPATTLADGTPVTGYTVTRTNATTGQVVTIGSGCAGTRTTTSCTETGVPNGRWTYAVTARLGATWTGPASRPSAEAIADTIAPTNALSISVASGRAVLIGSTIYYRGAGNGSVRILNRLTDDLSGPAQSVTGRLTGDTTGWEHQPGPVSTATPDGSYVSNPVIWNPGTTSGPTLGISGIDVAGNTAAATLTFENDSTAPSSSISYTTTTRRTAQATASIAITLGAVTEAGSGLTSGVAALRLEQRTATLRGDTCDLSTASSWSLVQDRPGSTVTASAAVNTCVQYRYFLSDAVANEATTIVGGIVKVKPQYASLVQGTSGLMRQYRFDGTGTVVADSAPSGQTFSGTAYGSPTTGQPGAIAGDSSTSMYFDGVDDFVRTARGGIGGSSFSIELWFNTTQRFGSGSQWYNGAGLVDAEVGGVANDFGLSLVDGRVAAGVGRPDATAMSQNRYDDGRWHHAVMTRTIDSGLVVLYVDGMEVARTTGGVQRLNDPRSIDFGQLQTGINRYRGYLDEVAIYNQVMTPADVQAHYANGL